MPIRFLAREKHPALERSLLRRAPGVLVVSQSDEAALLDTDSERYFTLNDVGSHIWSLLASPTTLDQIVTSIHEAYEVPSGDGCDPVTGDVMRLLRDLQRAGLIVVMPLPEEVG
jgi:hypothetical protein